MNRLILCCSLLLVSAGAACADRVTLLDSGQVEGAVTQLVLKTAAGRKVLARKQFRSAQRTASGWRVAVSDGKDLSGEVLQVKVSTVAGELTFAGAKVRSVRVNSGPPPKGGAGNREAPDSEPELPPVNFLEDDPKTADPKRPALSEEKKERLRALIRHVALLREKHLKKADAATQEEYQTVKATFKAQWDAACREVVAARQAYAKVAKGAGGTGKNYSGTGLGVGFSRSTTVTSSPQAAAALKQLHKSEQKKDALARRWKEVQRAFQSLSNVRRQRVRALHDAIYRKLVTGHEIDEDVMSAAFAKVLSDKKK
jgi:hypothetical protein